MVNNAIIFVMVSVVLTLIFFALDRRKTIMGLKKGLNMFRNIAVPFLNILILVSLVLHVVPPSLIVKYLGAGAGFQGMAIAKNIFIYLGAFSSLKIPSERDYAP